MVTRQVATTQFLPATFGAEELHFLCEPFQIPERADLNHIQLVIGQITRMAHDDDVEILTVSFPSRIHAVKWTRKKKVALLKIVAISQSVPRIVIHQATPQEE